MTPRLALPVLCALASLGLCVPAWSQVPAAATGNVPLNISPGGGGGAQPASPQGGGQQGGGQQGGATTGNTSSSGGIIASVSTYDVSDPDQAFYGLSLPPQQLYRGVIPGLRDSLPHIRGAQARGLKSEKSHRLTWIGYQRLPDRSRVFLQTYGVPAFRVERGQKDGEVLVVLQDTRVGTYNFKRLMDTRYFPRSISGVRSYRKGRDTYVSIQLRDKVEFAISVQGNYLFVDFEDASLEQKYGAYGAQEPGDLNGDNDLREID
jgi:hypothetical protein